MLSDNDRQEIKKLQKDMYSVYTKIEIQIREEIDKYIFTTLCDGITRDYQTVVSKELLIAALKYFKEKQPELYQLYNEKVMIDSKLDRQLDRIAQEVKGSE